MFWGLALALFAALSFVGFDVARKRLSSFDAVAVTAALSLAQGLVFAGWWAVLGVDSEEHTLPPSGYWLPGSADLAFNVIAGILFVRSLALSPFSRTIPLLSLSPVFATVGAVGVLQEVPSWLQVAGIVVTVWGALLINADRARGTRIWGVFKAVYRERGSFLMVLVALAWAFTLVLDKQCLAHTAPSVHATIQTVGVGVSLTVFLTARGRIASLRVLLPQLGSVFVAALLGCAALAFQLFALTFLLAAIVETVKRGVGVVASVLVGRVAFSEPVTRHKVQGGLLIILGTTVLAFAP